jgi:hypothetical protein
MIFLEDMITKIYMDDLIVRLLKRSVGNSYLDITGPGDIAYVIALVKNGKEVWDQDLCYSATGAAAMATREEVAADSLLMVNPAYLVMVGWCCYATSTGTWL